MSDVWERLAAPFAFRDIEVKPQSTNQEATQALAVAYIDARAAQRRLDEVFTPAGWSFETRECHIAGGKSGMIGRLTIHLPDGRNVVREDGSETTDIEPLKGGISGAFKRCFSALGARYLYDVDLGWQACEPKQGGGKPRFKKWTNEAMRAMEAKYNAQTKAPVVDKPRPAPELREDAPEPKAGIPVGVTNGAVTEPARPRGDQAPDGKNAFGYIPVRWPLPKMFQDPASESQVKMWAGKCRERAISEEDSNVIRRLVLEAYGLEDDSSKATYSLAIDWVINADEESLDQAVAAAEAASVPPIFDAYEGQ